MTCTLFENAKRGFLLSKFFILEGLFIDGFLFLFFGFSLRRAMSEEMID